MDVTQDDILESWDRSSTIHPAHMREGMRMRAVLPQSGPFTPSSDHAPVIESVPVVEFRLEVERMGQVWREYVVGTCGEVEHRVWQGPIQL